MTAKILALLGVLALPAFAQTPTPTPICVYGATGHTLAPPTSADNGQVSFSGADYDNLTCAGVDIAATTMNATSSFSTPTYTNTVGLERYNTLYACPKAPGFHGWDSTLLTASLRTVPQSATSADGATYAIAYWPQAPTPAAFGCGDWAQTETGTTANDANPVSFLQAGTDNIFELCGALENIVETGFTGFRRFITTNGAPPGANAVSIPTTRNADTGTVLEVCCGCEGDADRNGFVNSSDFAAVQLNFGRPSTPPDGQGDTDFNGFVNSSDFAHIQAHFGIPCPVLPTPTPIP